MTQIKDENVIIKCIKMLNISENINSNVVYDLFLKFGIHDLLSDVVGDSSEQTAEKNFLYKTVCLMKLATVVGLCYELLINSWDVFIIIQVHITLQWRHNVRDGVSNHQPHHCSSAHQRKHRSSASLAIVGIWAGNSPMTGKFPAQMPCDAANVSIWWRHHGIIGINLLCLSDAIRQYKSGSPLS